ncbi:MAG TPA: TIM barrel protein, partial [Methylomirabilota bacterium]|nr:TIM barrel protein [Methylomirabilota bacterium]
IQVGVGGWAETFAGRIRDRRESLGLYLEGQIRLPNDRNEVERFERDVRQAKEAGATVLRTVMLSGRRYETFQSLESFREFRRDREASLKLAEPVARRHRVQLAVENHKDWRVPELLEILRAISSEHVGVCVDTGNSISLLEEPHEVVEAYMPWAMTTHFKDMAVQEYEEGFLLAEVPLGKGFLDLRRILGTLRKTHPSIRLNLEMITRDPLKVPGLDPRYWATFPNLPGHHLAATLAMVRKHQTDRPLPRVTGLSPGERLAFEERNVRESFEFGREHLGL